MTARNDATVIEAGQSEGRLSLDGVDLHCGEPIEVLVAGRWTPVRVEMVEALGWVGFVHEAHAHGEASVFIRLHPGSRRDGNRPVSEALQQTKVLSQGG